MYSTLIYPDFVVLSLNLTVVRVQSAQQQESSPSPVETSHNSSNAEAIPLVRTGISFGLRPNPELRSFRKTPGIERDN